MKTVAFYLPQFHTTPENDLWWGKGFTEWNTVRNARALFQKHNQPRIPYNDNYYCLDNYKTLRWQANIAKKNGIDAFCFYHYWFNGRKILEKPVEAFLKNKNIEMEFCLSWANESWTRTWNFDLGNAWYVGDDSKYKKNEYLIKQEYGDSESWKMHFDYLLPFFMDSRYLKIDGKPVFLIYKPEKIGCISSMTRYWRKLAIENGLPGIHFIFTNTRKKYGTAVDGYLYYEPGYTIAHDLPVIYHDRDLRITKGSQLNESEFRTYSYDLFWWKIIKRKRIKNKKAYQGLFCDYDDSPRRGSKGIIFTGVKDWKFLLYLFLYLFKSKLNCDKLVFITAWNEWSEGAYLEPDMKNEGKYLKAIKKARKILRF